ncbi:MAG: SurA N-terminal domain-containing protein, partial [Neisseriaceae bacterium]|nr:SurA N-terminal domain-containing protein [Neisseriaceae bacterium]
MKFFNKLITFTLLLISANIVFADVKWVDRIVVIVNKDIITERDIDDVMNNIRSTQDKNAKIDENLLRQSAIEQLIDKKLLLQAAHFKKIIVSGEEIENSIESIANSQGISKQKLYDTIAKEGVSREMLHKTIAENLYIEKVTKQYMENIPV